uniref:thioredoxin-dependent peroxiredoxin n=1 Tax=Anopheles farauti TaxID=69004 RepID=A0A182QDG6_9DIPT
MPKLRIPKKEQSPTDTGPLQGKAKRKNAHPVRKFFQREGETNQRCNFCGWITRENATRMVLHIVNRCTAADSSARREMSATVQDAEEREQQSFYTSFNKKDVHGLFTSIENDRKRQCVFCKWTTIRNLTRMRHHIIELCTSVPPNVRQRFMKPEHSEDSQCDSYCIINVEDGDKKVLQVVSSSSMDHSGGETAEEIGELVINPADYEQHEVIDTYYDEAVPEGKTVDEIEEDESENVQSEDEDIAEMQLIPTNDGYYTVCKSGSGTKLPVIDNSSLFSHETSETEVLTKSAEQNSAGKKRPMEPRKVEKRQHSTIQQEMLRTRLATEKPKNDAPIVQAKVGTRQFSRQQHQQQENIKKEDCEERVVRGTLARVPRETSTPLPKTAKQQGTDAATSDDLGSCHSFGGGHVYPQEAPRFVDHKLQYTKAVISRPAPAFEATAVVDGAFKKIKLSDYRGKYLVFFFYPLDFTFVCPTEILAFSDRVSEFKKLNTEVIAASIDSHFTHLAWINTPRKEGGLGKINIPLVSDMTHSISKDYGVYLDDLGHTLRGLFIIDDRGVLRQITMNDLPVGRSVDETLRLVQAFQYTDKHGEVCPAGWKPGQDTIVPNPEAKIKYFEKNH